MQAFIFFVSLMASFQVWGGQITGKVVGVLDGDTLSLFVECAKLELPIRLAGIDAPETGAPFSAKSKKSLSELAFGKVVTVDSHKRDKYGRYVGKVLADGLDVNLEQINRGLAWHYTEYAVEQSQEDCAAYSVAEQTARLNKTGLWSHKDPIPPWDWRDGKRPDPSSEQTKRTDDGQVIHIGPRGGRYIITPSGSKRYLSQDD